MKKIVYFEDVFGWAGIETFMTNVVKYIDRDKYNIDFVLINKITDHYDEMFKEYNVNVVTILPNRIENPFDRLKAGLHGFKEYLKHDYDGDAIHFNISNSIDMLYVRIARKYGVKVCIAHSHNSSAKSKSRYFAHYFLKPFVQNTPSDYLACSHKAAKWLYSKKIADSNGYYLIKNAIDTSQYLYDQQKRNVLRDKYNLNNRPVFIHVGRFNTQKNHKFLIDIFEKIYEFKPNAILILAGEGELKEEIEEYVKSKNLDKAVKFLGAIDNVNEMLLAADVFILPSLYEGLPFVLVESQAASIPAIVSDSITDEVVFSDYINFKSLKNSVEDWAKAAIDLLDCKRELDLDSIQKSGFDMKTMITDLTAIYDKILE